MNFQKVSKENFGGGSISLYLNAINESSMINYITKDREIEGKLVLNIMIPTFLKGIWVKILGNITINYPDSKVNQYNINTFDLFKDSDEYYLDGLHEVLLGFGEEDNSYGSLIDIKPGRYHYPFLFKLPYNAPASFFDTNVNISYKIIVILDSPSISTISNKIKMENEIIVPNYSKLYCLKLREDITVKRDTLKVGKQLYRQNNQSLYFFPTILNIIRTPLQFNATLISIKDDSHQMVHNSDILSNSPKDLNFENKKILLEFECNIQNIKLRNPILVKCDLYSEICIKSSPAESFPVNYPILLSNQKNDKNHFIRKISESNQTISLDNINKFCIQFPIEISVDPYFASLKSNCNTPRFLSQLIYNPENKGKIIHYTIENPLFRIRVMFKMSLLKQNQLPDKFQELASAFGEIYISPPFLDNNKNDIRSIPRTSFIDAERTIVSNQNNINNHTEHQLLQQQDNTRLEVLSSRVPLQDRSLFVARPTSGIRSSRNVGGVASFRLQHINNLDTENIHNHINILPITNTNINKTPHARPSKSKRVITVQAELLSRGPAAAVIDRQDRSIPNNLITTPQRFAMMYEMCSASVLDGSPIVCASTPITLSTVDFNRIREQNNNQHSYSFGSININTPINDQSVTQENRQETQYDVVDLLLYNNQSRDISYLNSVPNTARSSTTNENALQELSIIL